VKHSGIWAIWGQQEGGSRVEGTGFHAGTCLRQCQRLRLGYRSPPRPGSPALISAPPVGIGEVVGINPHSKNIDVAGRFLRLRLLPRSQPDSEVAAEALVHLSAAVEVEDQRFRNGLRSTPGEGDRVDQQGNGVRCCRLPVVDGMAGQDRGLHVGSFRGYSVRTPDDRLIPEEC